MAGREILTGGIEVMKKYEVIIIGAGMAGLSLAGKLAGSKLSILLIDRKSKAEDISYYSSGSFVPFPGKDFPADIFHHVKEIYFCSKNRVAAKKVKCAVLDRKKLLVFFEKQAKRNKNLIIEYKAGFKKAVFNEKKVRHIEYKKNGRLQKAKADIFVDCSGLSAVFTKKTGLLPEKTVFAPGIEYIFPLKKHPRRAYLFVGDNLKGGYGWVFPKSSGLAVTGFGTIDRRQFSNITHIYEKMFLKRNLAKIMSFKPKNKAAAVLRTGAPLRRFVRGNVVAIGDCVLQANPLIGEGMRFVADAASIAASKITKYMKNKNTKVLKEYEKEWKSNYYKKYKTCFFMQNVLKKVSYNDKILDMGVGVLKASSPREFMRLLSGNISYYFLFKLVLKAFIKVKILKKKY